MHNPYLPSHIEIKNAQIGATSKQANNNTNLIQICNIQAIECKMFKALHCSWKQSWCSTYYQKLPNKSEDFMLNSYSRKKKNLAETGTWKIARDCEEECFILSKNAVGTSSSLDGHSSSFLEELATVNSQSQRTSIGSPLTAHPSSHFFSRKGSFFILIDIASLIVQK
ncbi:Uncharacterized protein Fot_23771 [Forsythia ovata]|uniref:Uncharacterized protein n=1 Tax=Forsythia ovata TaxID=205694 RepID=A0ABD1U514_9LAMI